jgi:hypothetical protein
MAETGLRLRPGDKLGCVTRNTWMSTMTVLGAPGEVYLLTHSVLRARFGLPTTSRVEQIDPITLKTLRRRRACPADPCGRVAWRFTAMAICMSCMGAGRTGSAGPACRWRRSASG